MISQDIPTSVRIGTYVYSIESFSPMVGTKDSRIGTCYSLNLEIQYQEDLPEQRIATTLLHEILHAMWYNSGLHLEHREAEEEHVTKLTYQLSEFIRNNPHVISWMSGQFAGDDTPEALAVFPIHDA